MTDYIYSRISANTQIIEHQTNNLSDQYPDALVIEEKASGKSMTDRPKLQKLLNDVLSGDRIIIRELSRLGRNTQDVLRMFEELEIKNVSVLVNDLQIDSTSATGKMVLTIMAAVSTMERDIMKERQKAGIAHAQTLNKYKGRPVNPLTEKKCKEAISYFPTMSKEKAAKAAEIGIATLYKYLKTIKT